MAIYTFKCPRCQQRKEVMKSMKDLQGESCCNCNIDMVRDFQADLPHAAKDYSRPIHSDALAISPTQITEHKQRFPNIELDGACRPVFDNFANHEAYMKKCGIMKHPQKTKPKGKRIA